MRRVKFNIQKMIISIFIFITGIMLSETSLAQGGMISYWKLDEGSGTTAFDDVDNNNGTLTNGPQWTIGKIGSALNFDGVNDYVNCGNGSNLKIYPPLSVEAWVNPSVVDVNAPTGKYILSNGDQAFRYYSLGLNHSGLFNFGVEASTENLYIQGELAVPNEWQHVVGVHDGSNIYIYVNGELSNSASAPLRPDYESKYSNAPLTIAIEPSYMYSSTHWFNGLIDEVTIYNGALTPAIIQQHYLDGPSCISFGSVAGTVSVNGNGLEGVTVKLLDDLMMPVDDMLSSSTGDYSFSDIAPGEYYVMIVEPLGYVTAQNPKSATIIADETTTVDFDLTEIVLINAARSKGYWKHQFDVYVTGKGHAQEGEQDLIYYIDLVHEHYTLYYDIFTDVDTFEEWQAILSLKGNNPMLDRAKQQLAALILNMVSDKIGQQTVVTDDGRDVGDVIQQVSSLIVDGTDSNDELAKNLAESVNNQQMISTGLVQEGDILFKPGISPGEALTYELSNNFPDPYNPTTTINYQIPDAGFVTLKVYDVLGNEVAILVNENKEPGRYHISFDASALSSGVYIYQLRVNDFLDTKKMILMK